MQQFPSFIVDFRKRVKFYVGLKMAKWDVLALVEDFKVYLKKLFPQVKPGG